MEVMDVNEINGISTKNPLLLATLMNSVKLAVSVGDQIDKLDFKIAVPGDFGFYRMAMSSAIQTVNALLTASRSQCNLDAPPADIEMIPGDDRRLIYRCQHPHPHEWNLSGEPI